MRFDSQRYIIVADNDGHEYMIPIEKRLVFCTKDLFDAEDSGVMPDYCTRIEGGVFSFVHPQLDGVSLE